MITNKDYIKNNISNNQEIDEHGDQVLINVPYRYYKCDCDCDYSIVPIFSMISFLAGYYLSKYNN